MSWYIVEAQLRVWADSWDEAEDTVRAIPDMLGTENEIIVDHALCVEEW